MTDLSLCTNRQLVQELCRRTTFCGVVVSMGQSYKGEPKPEEDLLISFNDNMERQQVSHLLGAVSQLIESHP